ncbi:MAG: DUF2271 domain-containing protein [Clostridiales bacterium]|nr:DUF2271 domain-containing protein [Clostridiales bacterium]
MTRKTCRHRKIFFRKATPAQLLLCILLCLTVGLSAAGCGDDPSETRATSTEKAATTTVEPTTITSAKETDGQIPEITAGILQGELEITLNYKHIDDIASNQYAVWIEDSNGKVIRTLFVTSFTAEGGWEYREDSLTVWVERSGMGGEDAPDIDAFSGATPQSGKQSYVWDCKDEDGQPIPAGEYRFFVDATIYWKDAALFEGTIELGGEEATAAAEPTFTNDEAKASDMITDVSAVYRP